MRTVLSFLGALTRTTLSLALLAASFLVADYLIRNTPAATAHRGARENAAAVLVSTQIYDRARREGYDAPQASECPEDCNCDAAESALVGDAAPHLDH